MSRKSRIRKINSIATVASSGNKSPDLIMKRSDNDPKQVIQAWARLEYEFGRLKRRFPYMTAERRKLGPKMGEWVIINKADIADKAGERAYRDLATQAAALIGYHGGPDGAVQFWFDHINGDHVIKQKMPEVNPNEVDLFTEHNDSDGTRELHIGRYKQGGEWSDTSKNAPVKPMEIPRPVVKPVSEPLIKVVSS